MEPFGPGLKANSKGSTSFQGGGYEWPAGQCTLTFSVPGGASKRTPRIAVNGTWRSCRVLPGYFGGGGDLGMDFEPVARASGFSMSARYLQLWLAVDSLKRTICETIIALRSCPGSPKYDNIV
jgi:hypothetical protein